MSYIPEDDMYYITRSLDKNAWGKAQLLSRTNDFKSVEEMGIIALPNNRVPCIFQGKVNGRYARLERPYGPPGTVDGSSIWISYSEDLIHWGDYQPLLMLIQTGSQLKELRELLQQ